MDFSNRTERYATLKENEPLLSWLRQEEREEVLEPELAIVDPHHHLWDRRRDACKYRSIVYGLEQILEDMYDGHNIVATVFCQSKWCGATDAEEHMRFVNEVEFCQGVSSLCHAALYGPAKESQMGPCTSVCSGIIGEVDLRHPKVEEALSAMMKCANFRGIRMRSNVSYDDDFKRGFRILEKHGLIYDAWHDPKPAYVAGELPKLAALAKEFPRVTIVLNHLGGVVGAAIQGSELEKVWHEELKALAACPNVVCKVGGIIMPINGFALHKRLKPIGSEELTELTYPWFSHAIDCFGPSRCMFESNFPVDKESVTYRTLWNMFKRVASKKGLSGTQKQDIFHDTAVRVYKLSRGISETSSCPASKRQKVQ